jgi:methyltransferase
MIFHIFFFFIIIQRLIELQLARRNERIMKEKGAFEVGQEHYKYIVLLHSLFLLALYMEVSILKTAISPIWPFLLAIFVSTQVLRVWVIKSLGYFWNTKIIILKGANVVRKGPFLLLKHPNYVIVAIEILVIPLIFSAYATAIIFTIANAILLLKVRIPMEEQALIDATNYNETFMKMVKS